jgi:uncharacterized surface protein with fasciclin (FAS1) repeats
MIEARCNNRTNIHLENEMKITKAAAAAALCALCLSIGPAFAADKMDKMGDSMSGMQDPMVGGHAMYASKSIVANALNSDDHTTLVAAVKAAGLVDTLNGPGPFTVFAPTNEAFNKLPAGTVDTLVKPENKPALTKILTYHVVPGRLDSKTIAAQIAAGGGKAMLKTVQGEDLTASMDGKTLVLTDAKGDASRVTIGDVYQSNGVIHVVDAVLMP